MIQKFSRGGRLELSLLLLVMSACCLGLSLFRHAVTDSPMYLFLNWNLFLAFAPWALSSWVMLTPRLRQQKMVLWLLLAVWILFFPNSPYILTDLYHLRRKSAMPVWFDVGLILSFAWTGLLYGFISLLDVEQILAERIGRRWTGIVSIFLLFLGGFGIYLGRFLRWNSWDVIHAPGHILHDIGIRLVDPLSHPRTWGVTLLMGLLLNGMFWSIKLLRKKPVVSPSAYA